MCTVIFVAEQMCETQGELALALGGPPVLEGGEHDPEVCCCPVDIPATAEKYGYSWKTDEWCDVTFTKRHDGDKQP